MLATLLYQNTALVAMYVQGVREVLRAPETRA